MAPAPGYLANHRRAESPEASLTCMLDVVVESSGCSDSEADVLHKASLVNSVGFPIDIACLVRDDNGLVRRSGVGRIGPLFVDTRVTERGSIIDRHIKQSGIE